ncbi:hypothetical protein KR018_009295, partial [Drosophila ironensis]
MFWGLSTALDLYEEYLRAFKINDEPLTADELASDGRNAGGDDSSAAPPPRSLNILLMGETDVRHVIRTLAKRYTHRQQPELHFYVLEGCAAITARHMLLLAAALEDPASFSLVSKAHLFMDLYGNAMMRPSSHHYMATKGRTLLEMVTDDEKLQRLAPMLNIECLKYKERDGLETSFTYWQPRPEHTFDMTYFWGLRLRKLLGTRYDHRNGVFDWDLSMTLKDRGGSQICSQEYRYWRESGVAFVFPEYEQCKPNKTLSAGLVRDGNSFTHRGFVGDIQTGPFCGFGLRTSEERMHRSVHGDNDYRATDVTERNLLELLHELQTQTAYEHDPTRSRRYGAVKLLMTPVLSLQEQDDGGQAKYDRPWIPMPGVTVHYLSPLVMSQLQAGSECWKNKFDVVFAAYNYSVFIKQNIFDVLRDNALFVMETMLMTVERNNIVQEFESKGKTMFKQAGLKPVINYNAINGKNMVLRYKKSTIDDGNDADGEEEQDENENDSDKDPNKDE